MNNKLEVIGIDHGWSMMKTISQVFVTGVKEITTTPALFGDVLEYEGKFYKVGTVRQEVKDTKVEDDSFYLLTLAAVAKELKRRGLAEAKVFLAVGLPLTRFGAEKNDFIKYLTKNKRVSFKYENEPYYIEMDDVAVFPQCYAAVVDKIPTMAKKTLIVDIGSWTIDIMPVINKSPDESKCVTIPKGLITCMRSINEQCVRQLNGEVDESEIQNIMRYGRSDIDDEYFAIIKAEIEDFVDKVYNSIREFGYNLKTTPIVFVGGGAVVMKNFGSYDAKNISYNLDVKANAMVWVIVADIFGTGSGDSAARKLCNTAPSPDSSYSYYERLRDNISSSYNATLPSFASRRTSEAPTYELKWNEGSQRFETTLSDSNGVLSDFDFGISGYSVDKNGNSITISSTSVNTTATTGTFTSNAGNVCTRMFQKI